MTDVARLGVGIELVGRRRGGGGAHRRDRPRRAPAGRPGSCCPATPGSASPGWSPRPSERAAASGLHGAGRALPGHRPSRRCPTCPFTEIVGSAGGRTPELVARARRAAPPAARRLPARRRQRRRGPRARPAAGVRRRALGARRARRRRRRSCSWSRTCTGPTGPAATCWSSCSPGSADQRLVVLATYRTDDLHRRHPLRPVLSELVRLPAVERVELAPLDAGEHARSWSAQLADGTPVRADACAGRPGAARATRSSPRSWSSASSDGAAARAGRGAGRPGRAGCRPTAQQVLRIASVAGRRVRHDQLAAVSGPGRRRAGAGAARRRRPPRAGAPRTASPTDGDAYVVPARAAARGDLPRAAARRAQPAARRLRRAARRRQPAEPPGEPGRRAGPPRDGRRTTCRWRWPRRCGPPTRPTTGRRPAEMLLHAERAIELWPAVPDAEAVAGVDEGTLTRWAAWGAERHRRPRPRHRARPGARSSSPSSAATRSLTSRSAGGTRCACSSSRGREQEALAAAERALALHRGPAAVGRPGLGARRAGQGAAPARPLRRGGRREAEPRCEVARRRPPDDRAMRLGAERRRAGHAGRLRRVRRRSRPGPAAARAGQAAGPHARATSGWSCAPTTTSASPCSTPAGSPRPRHEFAAGEAPRRHHRHHLERRTGSTCGSRTSSPGSCAATGTPRRPRPSWPASRCRPRWPPGSPRWGCSRRWPGAGSTPAERRLAELRDADSDRRAGDPAARPGRRRGRAVAGPARPRRPPERRARRWPACDGGLRDARPAPGRDHAVPRWAWPRRPTWRPRAAARRGGRGAARELVPTPPSRPRPRAAARRHARPGGPRVAGAAPAPS